MKKTITIYNCDICSSETSNDNIVEERDIDVIFKDEKQYLKREKLDICAKCMCIITEGNYVFLSIENHSKKYTIQNKKYSDLNSGNCNSGYYNTGNFNSGDKNSGYDNTGDYNSGDRNTGDYNSGYYNTGNVNSGDKNSGYDNTGNYNSGDRNTGEYNSGDRNTGFYNSGDYNSGFYNTGDFNSGFYNTGNFNTGFFNTTTPTARLFNKDSGLHITDHSRLQTLNVKPLLRWFISNEMTEQEKKENKSHETTGGFLKNTGKNDWSQLTEDDKNFILNLPNYDDDIFKEITGISLMNK